MLNNLNRNTYYAYRKMLENNNQKKSEKNLNINNNKYENTNNLTNKNSYSNFRMVKQKSYCPFGFTEKRFKWQNLKDQSNLIEPNDVKNKLKRIKINNELDGGFKKFYNNSKDSVKNMVGKGKATFEKIKEKITNNKLVQWGMNNKYINAGAKFLNIGLKIAGRVIDAKNGLEKS